MLNDDIFTRCSEINDKLNEGCVSEARAMVIKLLDCLEKDNDSYMPLINHLVREVGLYPYMNPETSNWEDRFAYEAFKTDIGEDKKYALHLDQSLVLKRLLLGDSIAVSAPTSFGKSFIIDAYIAIKRPNIVVDIVPTVALADETRRRLTHKFGDEYKIITTTDATVAEKSIFVFPQERAFAYIQILEVIDILIVDEFYKASAKYDDSRSSTLLNTMIELGKKAKLTGEWIDYEFRLQEKIEVHIPKHEQSTHTARRTFIVTAINEGVSTDLIMLITSHSDYKAMKPYIKANLKGTSSVIAALDRTYSK